MREMMDESIKLKQELKTWYMEQYKPDMGVLLLQCNATGRAYLLATRDLKGTRNELLFELEVGIYSGENLQADWTRDGEAGFTIEVLETIDYDVNQTEEDYIAQLAFLLEKCSARFENKELLK